MTLLEWLSDVAACRQQPDRLCFDGLEEALLELRTRSAQTFADPTLQEMADLLASVADELEQFLDSGTFYHLDQATARARDIALLQDGLQLAA